MILLCYYKVAIQWIGEVSDPLTKVNLGFSYKQRIGSSGSTTKTCPWVETIDNPIAKIKYLQQKKADILFIPGFSSLCWSMFWLDRNLSPGQGCWAAFVFKLPFPSPNNSTLTELYIIKLMLLLYPHPLTSLIESFGRKILSYHLYFTTN